MGYSYSDEIVRSSPVSVWCLNVERPLVQKYLRRKQAANERLVKQYAPLYGARVFRGTYRSGDGKEIRYFSVDSDRTAEKAPCMLYFHGGAFIDPVTPQILNTACYFAARCGLRVLIPDYRRALDVSCRTTLEDCRAMIRYAHHHADELGIDPERMIFYGDSAGGALCAGMTLLARDQGEMLPLAQMLVYPVLDCHNPQKYLSIRQYAHAPWPASANRHMWRIYLKKGAGKLYPYVVPMQHPSLDHLPPSYVEPQEIDILRDEAIAYAKKLRHAGNKVTMNIVMGTYHGFDFDHTSSLVQRVLAQRAAFIRKCLQEKGTGI